MLVIVMQKVRRKYLYLLRSQLTVFRSFFVSPTLPNTVVRGEQAVIQAIVFNYLPQDEDVSKHCKIYFALSWLNPVIVVTRLFFGKLEEKFI